VERRNPILKGRPEREMALVGLQVFMNLKDKDGADQ
jgi:hypothetical protein